MEGKIQVNVCMKCGHVWHPRKAAALSVECPNCKSRNWSRLRARQLWARRATCRAVESGLLPVIVAGTLCVDCGGQAEVYDHRDYNRPLDVAPVCKACDALRGETTTDLSVDVDRIPDYEAALRLRNHERTPVSRARPAVPDYEAALRQHEQAKEEQGY